MLSATTLEGPGYVYPPPESDEFAALVLLNADRKRHGVGPLKMSYRLCYSADVHSSKMVAKRTIFHSSGAELTSYGGPAWNIVGENVGMGDSVPGLNDAFMNSPEHRRNITSPRFSAVGIGIKASGGVLYTTHIFWG